MRSRSTEPRLLYLRTPLLPPASCPRPAPPQLGATGASRPTAEDTHGVSCLEPGPGSDPGRRGLLLFCPGAGPKARFLPRPHRPQETYLEGLRGHTPAAPVLSREQKYVRCVYDQCEPSGPRADQSSQQWSLPSRGQVFPECHQGHRTGEENLEQGL